MERYGRLTKLGRRVRSGRSAEYSDERGREKGVEEGSNNDYERRLKGKSVSWLALLEHHGGKKRRWFRYYVAGESW